MKPAIHYTIAYDFGKYEVFAVTSESRYGRVNGRYVNNDRPSHKASRDCIGKFDTLEAATEKVAEVNRIKDAYKAKRHPHERELNALYAAETNAIKECLAWT